MENLIFSITAIQEKLGHARMPSMLIGGVAVAVWGEPRLTRDVDLKVLVTRDDAAKFIEVLAEGYQMLVDDPVKQIKKQGLLFVQDSSGTRIDLLFAETPYDVSAIRRARKIEMQPGIAIQVRSPEDLVIYKLISTRARDHEDARSVVLRQKESLDHKYVLDWLRQFEQALDDSTLIADFKGFQAV